MRIISEGQLPGQPPGDQPVRLTCANCNTVFEATWLDRMVTKQALPRGTWMVRCPLPGCEKTVHVYPRKLP